MSIQDILAAWEQLLTKSRQHTTARRVRRPGQSPSTVPIPGSWHLLPEGATPLVLLYRDSNSWCPFCERVWFALEEKQIPFATEFIDLSHKPQWYLDLVPTALVPAAKIEGELVYESKDILLKLETQFGQTLLPSDPAENALAHQWLEACETGGFLGTSYQFLRQDAADTASLAELESALEAHLDELEQNLSKYPGPYFLSDFSLVDSDW